MLRKKEEITPEETRIKTKLIEFSNIPEDYIRNKLLKKFAKDNGYTLEDIKKEVYNIIQKRLKEQEDKEKKETPIINLPIVPEQFKQENLLNMILEEISKDHLGDDNLKMTLFLVEVSSLLKNPKFRMSMMITGGSAEGKDNMMRATAKHLPKEACLFITSGTQATLEDDAKTVRCIIISEVNLFREGGANKHLLEVIKQRTEGGTSALKKDLRDNNKSVRYEEGEQGSVIFGTTDFEQNEELGTRLMKGTIKTTPKRIQVVNENTFDNISNEQKIISQSKKEDSWIRQGLTNFFKKNNQYEIIIPYAKYLKDKIDGHYIFDYTDARSQRDIKRLLALTCAMTYIFQKQRKKMEVKGVKFLVSEVQDFINTLKYSNEFFNQTYSGFDLRVSDILRFFETKPKEYWLSWIDKLEIQDHLHIKTRATINGYLWDLEQAGFLERQKGDKLSEKCSISVYPTERLLANTFKGNHIYYRSVQKTFNKRLISVQLKKLKDYLENISVQKSVQFEKDNINNKKNEGK